MRRDQHPQPFWRAARHCYYVELRGKQVRLDPDRETAFQLYHEMMSRPAANGETPKAIRTDLVVTLLDAFLDWVKVYQAARTYAWHADYIQAFVDSIPPTLTLAELKPFHVSRVIDAKTTWSASTKNGFARSIQRAMNWAEKQGLIERNPIRYVERPSAEARETPLTPAEFAKLMKLVKDEPFRDLLMAAWDSGARPNELMHVGAQHCEFPSGRWVFPRKESKGKKKPRVVYLSDRVVAICRRLAEQYPEGPLFRNEDGNAWKKDAINCRFQRLKKHMGRKICLYDFRHGYCHERLKNGVDALTVANLLGHQNPTMVATVYSSLSLAPEFLREQASKGRRSVQPDVSE